jgi:hypothetical protein
MSRSDCCPAAWGSSQRSQYTLKTTASRRTPHPLHGPYITAPSANSELSLDRNLFLPRIQIITSSLDQTRKNRGHCRVKSFSFRSGKSILSWLCLLPPCPVLTMISRWSFSYDHTQHCSCVTNRSHHGHQMRPHNRPNWGQRDISYFIRIEGVYRHPHNSGDSGLIDRCS